MSQAKSRPAKRRIGFTPKGADVDRADIEQDESGDLTEKVKNPFKALGLRPAHVDYHANNPADRIYAWYMDGSQQELSPEDEWYHHVFKTVHSCQINGYTDSQIAKVLRKYFDLSERLAYKYIYSAQTLFGNVSVSDKHALRHMLTQMARSCYAYARRKGDVKAALLAIREMKTINGVDRDDAWITDPQELGQNTFMIQINMATNSGEQKSVTLDLNQLDAEQQKLLSQTINQMDQASEDEIIELIEQSNEDPE